MVYIMSAYYHAVTDKQLNVIMSVAFTFDIHKMSKTITSFIYCSYNTIQNKTVICRNEKIKYILIIIAVNESNKINSI